MKRLLYLLVALCLTSAILIVVAADVNHGYGPGYQHEDYGNDHVDDRNGYGYDLDGGDHNDEYTASGGH